MSDEAELVSLSPPAKKRPKFIDNPNYRAQNQRASTSSDEYFTSRPTSISNGNGGSLVSSNSETSNGIDSGFSDSGATPPASGEDSQGSFADIETGNTYPTSFDLTSSITVDNHQSLEIQQQCLNNGLTNNHMSRDGDEPDESNEDEDEEDRPSDISAISDISESEINPDPDAGPFSWVQHKMMSGVDPRALLQNMLSPDTEIPEYLDQLQLWKIILKIMCEPPKRKKLASVNTLEDAVDLIRKSKKIIILTGAGVSVSCGIPDFRSRDGVYARLAVDFPDLPDPQAMFDIQYFRKDPRPFFKFAREIYPGQFQPSPCHRFIKNVEKNGKLLRNYTQNIDTLEQIVGITRVIQCHGSFATATCTKCKLKVDSESIKEDIFKQRIPFCPVCPRDENFDPNSYLPTSNTTHPELPPVESSSSNVLPQSFVANENIVNSMEMEVQNLAQATAEIVFPGIMKPDIIFFGESLGDEFHNGVEQDKNEADLLIMIGSSLKVRPVALIPSSVPSNIPQILINREPLSHLTPDIELLGDCDDIINQICHMLGQGWEDALHKDPLEACKELLELDLPRENQESEDSAPIPSTSRSVERLDSSLEKQPEHQTSKTDVGSTFPDSDKVSQDSRKSDTEVEVVSSASCQNVDSTESQSKNETISSVLKSKQSLANKLPNGSYYFQPPNRYIFPGAEIYGCDEDCSDSDDTDSDDSSTNGEEHQSPTVDDVKSTENEYALSAVPEKSEEQEDDFDDIDP